MNKIIIIIMTICLISCASSKKCPNVEGFNSVIEKGSCKIRIRNTFFADQLSSDTKEKLKQGQQAEFIWVPTVTKNQAVVPAHFEVKTVVGDQQ